MRGIKILAYTILGIWELRKDRNSIVFNGVNKGDAQYFEMVVYNNTSKCSAYTRAFCNHTRSLYKLEFFL